MLINVNYINIERELYVPVFTNTMPSVKKKKLIDVLLLTAKCVRFLSRVASIWKHEYD